MKVPAPSHKNVNVIRIHGSKKGVSPPLARFYCDSTAKMLGFILSQQFSDEKFAASLSGWRLFGWF